MRVLEIYKMNVVRDGSGNRVEDYTVKLKAESKRTIRVNAKNYYLCKLLARCSRRWKTDAYHAES